MITNALRTAVEKCFPSLLGEFESPVDWLRKARCDCSFRKQRQISTKQLISLNMMLKRSILKQQTITEQNSEIKNASSHEIESVLATVLNEYPGACYNIQLLINLEQLTLHDLINIDHQCLLSQNVDLTAFSLLMQSFRVTCSQAPQLVAVKYLLTYGGFHIFVHNQLVVKFCQQLCKQQLKQGSLYLLLLEKFNTKSMSRFNNQIYQFEASQIFTPEHQPQPESSYGFLVSQLNNSIQVTSSDYVSKQLENTNQQYGFLDCVSMSDISINAKLCGYGEVLVSQEILQNFRRPVTNLDQISDNKTVEVLVAVAVQDLATTQVILCISRVQSGFMKTMRSLGEENRVFVHIFEKDQVLNQFSDERKGMLICQITPPIYLQGNKKQFQIQNVTSTTNPRLWLIDFRNVSFAKIFLITPETIMISIEENELSSSYSKLFQHTKFTLESQATVQQTVTHEAVELQSPQDSEQFQQVFNIVYIDGIWRAVEITKVVNMEQFQPIEIQITCGQQLSINCDMSPEGEQCLQFVDAQQIICCDVTEVQYSKVFGYMLSQIQQHKLLIQLPFDFLIDAYISYMTTITQGDVTVQLIKPGTVFKVAIEQCLLTKVENNVLELLILKAKIIEKIEPQGSNQLMNEIFVTDFDLLNQQMTAQPQQDFFNAFSFHSFRTDQFSKPMSQFSAQYSQQEMFSLERVLPEQKTESHLQLNNQLPDQFAPQVPLFFQAPRSASNQFGQYTISGTSNPFDIQADTMQSLQLQADVNIFDQTDQLSVQQFDQLPGSIMQQPVLLQSQNVTSTSQSPSQQIEYSLVQRSLQNNYVQLSANSINFGSQISSMAQDANKGNQRKWKLNKTRGYVRYHFLSYGIAIIAFNDPLNRQDSWDHSLAVWYLPEQFQQMKIRRNKDQSISLVTVPDQSRYLEPIYLSRALVECDLTALDQQSGIYIADNVTFLDYRDPCLLITDKQDSQNKEIEGSVYWQEINPSNKEIKPTNQSQQQARPQQTSYGFVRLASGHERHFYLKQFSPILGHLVKLRLFENDPQHPNSCEMLRSVVPPPNKNKWLFARLIKTFQDSEISQNLQVLLKQSFKVQMSRPNVDAVVINGFLLVEPMQGTHCDAAFFRAVLPKTVAQELQVGQGLYCTLKELALHKVVDEVFCKGQTPVALVNQLLQLVTDKALTQKQLNSELDALTGKKFKTAEGDIGNSPKQSCWAVDSLSIPSLNFSGSYVNYPERRCSGMVAEAQFLDKFSRLLVSGRESLIYVPRPTLKMTPTLFLQNQQFRFNVHFVFNDQKNAFIAEASQITRIKTDVSNRRISGKLHLLQQKDTRCPVYLFKPEGPTGLAGNDNMNLIECLTEQLTPETDCYVVKPTAFYKLQNEILNSLFYKQQELADSAQIFQMIISGELKIQARVVSIGLISQTEFESQIDVDSLLPFLTKNVYRSEDQDQKLMFWCRFVDEVMLVDDVGAIAQKPIQERKGEDVFRFLTY